MPAATPAMVLPLGPLTVHVAVVPLVKITGLPDAPPVALAVVVPPTAKVDGEKLMVPIVCGIKTPVPLKLTLCGLPTASLTTVIVPVRVPLAVGVKVILMVQLAAGASVMPQVVVLAKSPLATMLVIVSGPVPGFRKVIV